VGPAGWSEPALTNDAGASRSLVAGVSLLVLAVVAIIGWTLFSGADPDPAADDVAAAEEELGAEDGQALGTDASAAGAGPAGALAPSAPYPCSEADPSTWAPSPTSEDLVAATRAGTVPAPIATTSEIGPPTAANEFPTAADFLALSNVPDVQARMAVMEEAGYAGGIEGAFDDHLVSAQVLSFRDAAAASSYVEARLPNICRLRGTDQMVPLGDDGFAFVDGMGAVHGDFLLGGNQVSLIICGCSQDATIEVMERWYAAWVERFGASDAGAASDAAGPTEGAATR
jgi:hypothetical protein